MTRRSGERRFVYLVGAVGLAAVKIGSSRDVATRLAELQVGSPVKLALLWEHEADDAHALEHALHIYFTADRMHGEWFNLGPDPLTAVKAAVARLRNGTIPLVAPSPVLDDRATVLRDAAAIFMEAGTVQMFSAELVLRLRQLPHADELYNQMTPRKLAQLIAQGLGPSTSMDIGERRARGYYARPTIKAWEAVERELDTSESA